MRGADHRPPAQPSNEMPSGVTSALGMDRRNRTPITMKSNRHQRIRQPKPNNWHRQKQAVCQIVNAAIFMRNNAYMVDEENERVTMHLDTWALFDTAIEEFMDTLQKGERIDAWKTRW